MSEEARNAAGAAQRAGVGVVGVWRALQHERRRAAAAALALFISLFLPWYQETVIATSKSTNLHSLTASVTGWGAFSWVEAAVLLVAVGVLTLLVQRARGRAFHLPGGDGWVIMLAGGWTCCLVVWRIFDKQGTSSQQQLATTWGIEWGIFAALAVAAYLTYTGSRIRAAHSPEPPLPGDAESGRAAAGRPRPGGEGGPGPSASAPRPRPGAATDSSRDEPTVRRRAKGPPEPARPPRQHTAARDGERPVGWLSAGRPGAEQRGAPAPDQETETRSWSYRETEADDDYPAGEWPVADFNYSRSAPPRHRRPDYGRGETDESGYDDGHYQYGEDGPASAEGPDAPGRPRASGPVRAPRPGEGEGKTVADSGRRPAAAFGDDATVAKRIRRPAVAFDPDATVSKGEPRPAPQDGEDETAINPAPPPRPRRRPRTTS